ncbi:SGNH/GDSL hydrolase family protein [Hymenobacter sp. HD11105]
MPTKRILTTKVAARPGVAYEQLNDNEKFRLADYVEFKTAINDNEAELVATTTTASNAAAAAANALSVANSKASPADITAAINGLKDGAPAAYDTFLELAAAAESDKTGIAALLATQQQHTTALAPAAQDAAFLARLQSLPGYATGKVLSATADGFTWIALTTSTGETYFVTWIGDSIVMSNFAQSAPNQLDALLPNTFTVIDKGISANTLQQIQGRIQADVYTPTDAFVAANPGAVKVLLLEGAINNFHVAGTDQTALNAALATVKTITADIVTDAVSKGYKVLLSTLTPSDYQNSASFTSQRADFNNWLRTTYGTPTANTRLNDLAIVPELAYPATWTTDGIHPTQTGSAILAAETKGHLLALLGLASAPVPYALPPTNVTVNDTTNMLGWTDAGGLTFSAAEVSLNNGTSWNPASANPHPVGNVAIAIGGAQVRYAALANVRQASAVAKSLAAFTGASTVSGTEVLPAGASDWTNTYWSKANLKAGIPSIFDTDGTSYVDMLSPSTNSTADHQIFPANAVAVTAGASLTLHLSGKPSANGYPWLAYEIYTSDFGTLIAGGRVNFATGAVAGQTGNTTTFAAESDGWQRASLAFLNPAGNSALRMFLKILNQAGTPGTAYAEADNTKGLYLSRISLRTA